MPFGSFRDFVVLEELLIRHSHLGNTQSLVEILPISLKRLEVIDLKDSDDQVQLVSELSDLLHQGGCGNLERLDLQITFPLECEEGGATSRLERECKARGVFFRVKDY